MALWAALLGQTHLFFLRLAQAWSGVLPAWAQSFPSLLSPVLVLLLFIDMSHTVWSCVTDQEWFPSVKASQVRASCFQVIWAFSDGCVSWPQDGCCNSRHCIQTSCFPDREVQAQHLKIFYPSWAWWHMTFKPVLGSRGRLIVCLFGASLVSINLYSE